MKLGRGRIAVGAGVAAAMTLVAMAVWGGSDGGGHQSPEEIAELATLPEGVTPLDPAAPNPTGGDPSVVGTPPEFTPAASPETFLARAEQLRDAPAATNVSVKAAPDEDAGAADADGEPGPRADDDSLLVSFADGTSLDAMAAALDAAGVEGTPIAGTSVAEVDVTASGGDAAAVSAALEDVDAVESVDPNLTRSIEQVPNDPEYASQAPYLGTVHVPQAWDVADTRSSVTVAVLDTGVDLDHPDLVPNLVAGFDAVNEDNNPSDDQGHGTMVAGIIGASTGNGAGVAGVAWNARIMPVKVLGADGVGTDADVAQGIVWATDHGARVINMSLGGAGASAVIDDAVDYAIAHEVVLVAAAGNDASPVLQYPAAAPGVYGVTATDGAGKFAWFSNHGPWYYLAAPGIGIRSTAMSAGATAAYATGSGTSFSAPIVAGVMALVRERHPGWGWFEVGDEVVRTARDSGPAGLDDAYGFGLLDASAALGVSPIAGVSQPVRTGDAGDTQATARAITVGTNATESINYEYDEDWFAFTVPAAGASAIITVTPPALSNTDRALEMDPAIELYGPGGGRVGASDETFAGEPEQLQLNVGPGRHTVRVTNWAASASPSPYTVRVTLGAGLPPTAWATPLGEFGVENAIQAVASADFSGDGRDDVAVSTRSSNHPDDDFKIFVLTQAADGTLGAPQRLASHAGGSTAGENPLRATDMDGDGDVDLVLGTVTGLDVALNDGDGLTTPVLHPTDDAVRGIQTANLDGTGGTELIVEGQDPNGNASLSVVRWAAGDLATELLGFDAVGTRAGIAYDVADLTGDGRPDIATFAGGDVSLYAQQANGTWAAPTTIAMSGIAGTTFERALATADVSNDGRADLVTLINWRLEPDNGQFQTRVVYRLQLAGGAYGPPVVLPARSDTGAMKVGDVTGDGRNDVVVLHNNANNDAGLFRQNPTGGLAQEELLSEFGAEGQQSPDALAIGDVDDDGINDVMSGSPGLGLYIMRHQGAATTEGPGPWMAGGTPAEHATGVSRTVRPVVRFGRSIDVASVEANETVWLVDGRNGRNFDFSITRTNRDMTLWPIEPLTPGAPYQVWIFGVTSGGGAEGAYERIPFTVAAGAAPSYKVDKTFLPAQVDLDGNGYDDIFWYGTGSAPDSVWFFGPDAVEGVTTSVTGTYTPVPGDFDGNGYDDILWYGPGSATDALWKNGRNGIVSVAMPVGGVYSPIAGDFDGNGYDDIFWYAPGAAADSVWYFGPNGRTSVAQKVTGTAYRPVAGDFNRDGFDDIVWYAPGAAAESLWRGSRNGFAGAVTMSISGTYRGRTLDFNGDGFDEVYLYQPNRGVFWRSGTGGFTSVQDGPPIVSTGRPVTGDFTGDGRGDLFTYVPGTGADRFYRGNATGVG